MAIVLQPVRFFTVAAVSRSTTRLDVCRIPDLRPYSPQKGSGMERASTDLHIEWLENYTAMRCPKLLEGQNQALKDRYLWVGAHHGSLLQKQERR